MHINRVDLSREQLLNAFYYALGVYAKQEKWKLDKWQDQNIGQIFTHINSELKDITPHLGNLHTLTISKTNEPRGDSAWDLLRHCADLEGLTTILLVKVMQKVKLLK